MNRHVCVTGASSGIGQAVARLFAARGVRLSIGARRVEKLAQVGDDNTFRGELDVTDEASVTRFLDGATAVHGPIEVLINNAGLARGVEKIAEADGIAWREMIETNVLGLLHVTRRVVASMLKRGRDDGPMRDIVMIGSIAGREAYEGGSVYCASKHAVAAITKTLRYELLGTGIRVATVDPGMVETEFSVVRFRGDQAKADAVYSGLQPLTAEDIAECVEFVVDRPAHVHIDSMLVMPTDQASAKRVHRASP